MSKVKQQLIEVATEAAQKGGVRAITMRELGDAVGIKSASVMYHFKNKDGLLLAIVDSYGEMFFDQLARLNGLPPAQRLERLVDLFEDALDADRMCLCGMLAADTEQLDAPTRGSTRRFFRRLQTWVRDTLTEAGADRELAPLIVASLEGAMLLDRLDENNERLRVVRHWLVASLAA